MMRLTIFSRLVLSYLVISMLGLAASVYAIYQLREFEEGIRSILEVDNRLMDYEKKMTDALLSEMRFENKYAILRDRALYEEFLLARNDFDRYLLQGLIVANRSPQEKHLENVKQLHARYQGFIAREVQWIEAQEAYPQAWYRAEKEKVVDRILQELKNVSIGSQANSSHKIRLLQKASGDARRIAGIVAAAVLLGGTLISLLMTRSITRPISVLISKTREIANWVFRGDLRLTSPPEMKQLSQAFNTMCDQLGMVDKMKSDFFSTLSHELRTPLTSIKEGTSLLLEGIGGDLSEKQKKLLHIISGESRRLIELVNASLDISKMEAGMMEYFFAPADLVPLIQKAVTEIEPLAMSKGIRLQIESPPGLPVVPLDRERILQVLRNLLGNALKFTPQGGEVRVGAGVEEARLKVWVKDNGPGIAAESLPIVFEKFRQGALRNASNMKGTGLGLAITKHIIQAHGGKVWAESEHGRGSSFYFSLPA